MSHRRRSLWLNRDLTEDAEGGAFSHERWNPLQPEESTEEPAPPPPPKKRRFGLAASALAVSLLALGTGAAALLFGDLRGTDNEPAELVSDEKDKGLKRTDIGNVYSKAGDGVVSVQSRGGRGVASGTGFVVASDGTIVTNAHVVQGADEARVRFGDTARQVDAKVVGTDTSTDLAVLKVDPDKAGGLKPLTLANSDDVQVGDQAVAIGHPFGLDRTATAGIISGVGREIQAPNGFAIDEAIQTDAPINPGNSGGPLIDAKGRVIGVNSQIAAAGGGGNVGIGFAVPANTVKEVVPRLQRGEEIERPYLGVTTSAAPGGGAQVQGTEPAGPASNAGIETGDIVKKSDGKGIDEPEDVAESIKTRKPGERVKVVVERAGVERTVEVTLGTRPEKAP
ncbi:MAG: trypsin-like peptidase domain-containing protein [Thermoleophilaceae bacterium]|nr:trypsin-like peptidase domain-containing protein [Thermoleophilaceae bacterium]